MKLLEFEPEWVSHQDAERAAISFLCPCPVCIKTRAEEPEAKIFTRHIIPFANPIGGGTPYTQGATWQREGDTFESLRLSPSILRRRGHNGCTWHGHIGKEMPGEVTTC